MKTGRCCRDVEMGSYRSQLLVPGPCGNLIGVDACLVEELQRLWRAGIRTVGSCCGHGRTSGYIQVLDEDAPRMEALGYLRDPNYRHDTLPCYLPRYV